MGLQCADLSNPFFMFDVSQVCATCTKHLMTGSSSSLDTPIYTKANINLCQVLESQFQLKFAENGPNNVCSECVSKAFHMYEFYQQCKKSLILFKKHVEYQKQFTSLDEIDLTISDTDVNLDDEQDEKLFIEPEKNIICDDTIITVADEFIDLDENETFEHNTSCNNINSNSECLLKCYNIKQQTRKSNIVTDKSAPSNQTISEKKIFRCTYCDAIYGKYSSLKSHIYIHKQTYTCSYCGRAKASSTALKIHERAHTGEMPYSCVECHKRFRSNQGFTTHLLSHSTTKDFKCEICKKAFIAKSTLGNHLKTHTARKYKCSECNREYSSKYILKVHMLKVHENEETL